MGLKDLLVVVLDVVGIQRLEIAAQRQEETNSMSVEVLHPSGFNGFLHLFRMEVMENGTEGQAVPPGGAEVGDLHPFVTLGDFLTPFQEGLAGLDQAGGALGHRETL